jgi:hypothetical protein
MEGSTQTRKEHNLNQQQDFDLGHKLNTTDSETEICKGYDTDGCRTGNKYGGGPLLPAGKDATKKGQVA